MPSGPNVTISSGSMSAINSAIRSVPSFQAHSPSMKPSRCSSSTPSCGQAGAQLALAQHGQPLGRPRHRVARAALAERRRDHDDAVAAPAVLGHQAGRQVGLVVGVGPHAEQCARHDTAPLSSELSSSTSAFIDALESDQQLRDLGIVPLLAGDAVSDVEQVDADTVPRLLVGGERVERRAVAPAREHRPREQFRIAHGIGQAVGADRILEVPGVADERPTRLRTTVACSRRGRSTCACPSAPTRGAPDPRCRARPRRGPPRPCGRRRGRVGPGGRRRRRRPDRCWSG